MRLNESVVISAPPELVWDQITDGSNYLHFMSGITRWEVEDDDPAIEMGTRIRMLIRVGSAEVGGLIEIVEWQPERELAWTSVTGVDQRGRWRLRETPDGRTRVELRYAYGVAGSGIPGWIAELVASPSLGSNLRKSLHQLKRRVEHERLRAEAARRRAQREPAEA
jgi:uncharacterized membrane protein